MGALTDQALAHAKGSDGSRTRSQTVSRNSLEPPRFRLEQVESRDAAT